MILDSLFKLINAFVLVPWALMIFLPKWKYTILMVRGIIVPIILAVVYLMLVVSNDTGEFLDLTSLDQISDQFSNDQIMLAGWTHYLVFDLFIGSWLLLEMIRLEWSRILVVFCLLLTFMLGPIGLLAFCLVYLIKYKSFYILKTTD